MFTLPPYYKQSDAKYDVERGSSTFFFRIPSNVRLAIIALASCFPASTNTSSQQHLESVLKSLKYSSIMTGMLV